MAEKDYYKTLGVSEHAGLDEIKKVYRQLAMRYHPDRNQDNRKKAEDKFKELSEAYYVLSDPKKREEYDLYRKGGTRQYAGGFEGNEGFDYNEILRYFSSHKQPGFGSQRGARTRAGFDDIFDLFNNMGKQSYGGDYSDYADTAGHGGSDINATIAVSDSVLRNGGEIQFNHKEKKISLRIKPGTKRGQKLRMLRQGNVCGSCGHPGDLILTVK